MEQVPSFEVRELDGGVVVYRADIWQRQHLVLVRLTGESPAERQWLPRLDDAREAIANADAQLVITRDPVADLAAPSVVVADRWGEVQHAFEGELPDVTDLIEWVDWVSRKCPECEGEAR